MNSLQLLSEIIDDETIRLLAFEDRWHFIALLCLSRDGLLDEEPSELRHRKIAVKLGVQPDTLTEIMKRLREVDLVDEGGKIVRPERFICKNGGGSDGSGSAKKSSANRVRRHREKVKHAEPHVTPHVTHHVTPHVTPDVTLQTIENMENVTHVTHHVTHHVTPHVTPDVTLPPSSPLPSSSLPPKNIYQTPLSSPSNPPPAPRAQAGSAAAPSNCQQVPGWLAGQKMDLMELTNECCRRGGLAMVNPNQIGAAIDLVRAWVAAGADPETHIFPAISEALLKADRPIRALSFFDGWVRASVAKGLKSQDKKWEEAMLGILGKDAFEAIAQSKPTRSTGDGYNRDAITNMPEAFAEGAYKSKNEHSRVNVPGEVENRSQGNTEARRSIGGDFGVYA